MKNIKTANILSLLSIVLIFQTSCSANLNNNENPNSGSEFLYVKKSQLEKIELKVDNYQKRIDSLIVLNNFNNRSYYQFSKDLQNQIKVLNEEISSFDSLYKNLITELYLIENNINVLGKTYNEVAKVKTLENIAEIPPLNDEEFRQKYINALEAYQNADWDISLEGFKYLLLLNKNHDLSDNCQYWIGEVYFKKKQYHHSINEFSKVIMNYPNSNKIDDSMYQIGNCFISLGNIESADSILTKLIKEYKHSEYVKKATYLIQN